MRQTFWQKKIPTLFGILVIFFGIVATSFLTKNGVIFTGRASLPETPENIRITNITNTSFTISYTTSANVIGSVRFGKEKNLDKVSLDDRDQENGKTSEHKIHYITIKNLDPETKYYYSLISGETDFFSQTGDNQPFEIQTAPIIQEKSDQQNSIIGKVILPDGSTPPEAIVYTTLPNAQTISALVKPDGNYSLSLNSVRNQALNSYLTFADNLNFQLLILNDSLKSQITLSIKQINPVPVITLSKDYNFLLKDSLLATSSSIASDSGKISGFPSFSANPGKTKEPQIQTPKNNEGFVDNQPVFKGVAQPGEKVKIIIHSQEEIQTEVTADKNGGWTYRPSDKLSPGEHTITIITKDQFGILKTIKRIFTVYAAGSQVNESATPSATPTLVISTSPTPILSVSPTLTPSPKPTLIPTPTLIIQATILPTKIPQKKIDKPGNPILEKGGIVAGVLVVTGLLIFLLSRGSVSL